MNTPISISSIQQLFTEARTHHTWQDRDVVDGLLHEIYDLAKWGPTSANSSPMRVVFVKSKSAKEKLMPALNVALPTNGGHADKGRQWGRQRNPLWFARLIRNSSSSPPSIWSSIRITSRMKRPSRWGCRWSRSNTGCSDTAVATGSGETASIARGRRADSARHDAATGTTGPLAKSAIARRD
jgi:nitroreductase